MPGKEGCINTDNVFSSTYDSLEFILKGKLFLIQMHVGQIKNMTQDSFACIRDQLKN